MSLKFVPEGPISNIPALVQIMAWSRPGDKPWCESFGVSSLTHTCDTRPQWFEAGSIQSQNIQYECNRLRFLCCYNLHFNKPSPSITPTGKSNLLGLSPTLSALTLNAPETNKAYVRFLGWQPHNGIWVNSKAPHVLQEERQLHVVQITNITLMGHMDMVVHELMWYSSIYLITIMILVTLFIQHSMMQKRH